MKKYHYADPVKYGYHMEAEACKKVCKELNRLIAKFQRAVEREKAARQEELEAAMQYQSEQEIQDEYGYAIITEAQYERLLEMFRFGRQALETMPPTLNELALSILKQINHDICSEQREWEFSALTPEQRAAERKREEANREAWHKKIAELKAMLSDAEEG